MDIFGKTIELVKTKITGFRKGSDSIPNYLHSLRVYESLKNYGFDEDVQLAGLLHDIIEDGGMTLNELKELGYSENVQNLVDLSTHDSSIEDKFQRRERMLERLIAADNKSAWAIKLADISDNLLECHLMPKREKLERFLYKKSPVFIYYGNKYFGGTELYDEFLERYFKQMKDYNDYFLPISRKEITKEEFKKLYFQNMKDDPRGGWSEAGWNSWYEDKEGYKWFYSRSGLPGAHRMILSSGKNHFGMNLLTDDQVENCFRTPGSDD